MNYIKYMNRIEKALTNYKKAIDEIGVLQKQATADHKDKCRQMRESGKYSESYLAQVERNEAPRSTRWIKSIEMQRNVAKPIVDRNLLLIDREIDNYFNAPVSAEFLNKIQAVKLAGIVLTDSEFKMLEKQAHTYLERRALDSVAMNRTKKETDAELIGVSSSGEPQTAYVEKDVKRPYSQIDVPDMERIMKEYADYKRMADSLMNVYSGRDAELTEAMSEITGNRIDNVIAVSCDAFIRLNATEKIKEVFENANLILPYEEQRVLSAEDREIIDAIIDPKYPYYAETKVKEVYKIGNREINELLELDERYADIVEKIKAEE